MPRLRGKKGIYADKSCAERQYIKTALWSSVDEDGASFEDALNGSDFAEGEIEQALAELWQFLVQVVPLWAKPGVTRDMEQLGHDFWLTRNGHGAGFWARPEMWGGEENAQKLTEAARACGERYIYRDDEGQLHFEKG